MTELVKTETPLFACPKSPLSVTSSDRGVWRHKKRGTTYTIIGEAVAQASNGPIVDGEPVTIYRGEEGWVWVRNTIEFHDGRFERVSDGDAKHEDAQAAEPVGCQRGGEAETPTLSPDTLTQGEIGAQCVEILNARQKRAEHLHELIYEARELVRKRLTPNSPQEVRDLYEKLHAASYSLRGDPFDMHMRAALSLPTPARDIKTGGQSDE